MLISVAGPLTNLILSFLFYGLYFFGAFAFGWSGIVMQILGAIVSVNLWFAFFNILPIPPLDGFHVVTSLFVKKRYAVVDFLQRYGFIILIVLIFSGLLDMVLTPLANGILSLYSSFFSLFL